MKVNYVIGPPGTGKTSYLMGYTNFGVHHSGQVERAAAKFGSDKCICVMLTKAAASEASSRSGVLGRDRLGTLHSILYQALECPAMVTRDQVEAFNEDSSIHVTPSEVVGSSDATDEETGPSGVFLEYDLARAQCLPTDEWLPHVVMLDKEWRAYKRDIGVVDFTDLIEAAAWGEIEPFDVKAAFVDEAQDLSALEQKAFGWISQNAESVTQVGDPLQSLYGWRGADPDALLGGCDFRKVMPQSYRVPRTVHARAVSVVAGLPGSEATYLPVDREGEVNHMPWRLYDPVPIADDIEESIDHGESIMVLASCGYMLEKVKDLLRRRGVPFHNPYAPRNGGWNPLADKGLVKAFRAFMRPFIRRGERFWTVEEIAQWAKPLAAGGVFLHGKKKLAMEFPKDVNAPVMLEICLREEARAPILAGNLDFYLSNLLRNDRHLDYVRQTVYRQTAKRLFYELSQPAHRRPWAILGTIHSVKGGEADNVHVYPDLSPEGCKTQALSGWSGRESIRRMMYVARTRARRRLVLGQPNKVVMSFRE